MYGAFGQENDALVGGFFVAIGNFCERFRVALASLLVSFAAGARFFGPAGHHRRTRFSESGST